jgi:membrane-bound lytic murein transglycosylase B
MTKNSVRPPALVAHLGIAVAALFLGAPLGAMDTQRDDIQTFVNGLVTEHGFEQDYVTSVLSQGARKQKILDAISRPAEKSKEWFEYRDIFVTPKRIAAGVEFWAEHSERLARISAETGVPAEIIAAIVGVETYFGRITGSYRVLDALSTLGFDYPPRGKFFRGELEQLFLLSREESLDITNIEGSYAGAMGPPQFIPSSYRNFAVDGDGDGRRDLFDSWDDILSSVANYFVRHKWKSGQPIAVQGTLSDSAQAPTGKNSLKVTETVTSLSEQGILFATDLEGSEPAQLFHLEGNDGVEYWVGFHNFYVITRYNRSVMYALAVQQLAAALAEARAAAGPGSNETTSR